VQGMASNAAVDPNVLSYPAIVIMRVQGAVRQVRPGQPLAIGRGEIRHWSFG